MICSERELGLSEDHSGIMVLDNSTPVGMKLQDVLTLDTEILDFSITPNRADCLSVLGLARETAMAFHLPLTIKELTPTYGEESTEVPIEITDPKLCWLYAGRVVHNMHLGPSPLHIRQRLQACGIRAISNIVDVTNYILLECGQPLHAFDLAKLNPRKIVVRKARPNETFVTLDNQERVLKDTDLCICAGDTPVALAGVMGGLDSEITSTTTQVFVESAVFNPPTIRKTSRRLGLSSESSYRFERGIDQQRTIWALERATALLQELGQGTVDKHLNVAEPNPFIAAQIPFRPKYANALLGVNLEPDFAKTVFTGLGLKVSEKDTSWQVEQASWRPDLTREADLVEEVGRVYGLDNIKPLLPPMQLSLERHDVGTEFAFWRQVRHWGAGLGLNEVINYSFVGQKDLDLLGLPKDVRIAIKNPLSQEQDVLRPTIAPGLLQSLRQNLAQGAVSVKLFELCHVFTLDETLETHTKETAMLGLLFSGLRYEPVWPNPQEDMDYSDIRGVIEHLLRTLHVEQPKFVQVAEHAYLSPCVQIFIGDTLLGHVGVVKSAIADTYLAHKLVYLAEINLALLQELAAKAKVKFTPLAIYPCVKRDITFIGSKSLQVGTIKAALLDLKHPLICDVAFVSLYEPKESTDKHLSFRLTFRHNQRTLKDAEVDKERDKVAQAIVKSLGVRI